MAQEIASNTFTGGMVLDINEIDSPSNTYCSNALNATVATYNGNEGAIQNEMGNCKIVNDNVTAQLPKDSTILGSVEYGGVIYYVLGIPVIKDGQQVLDKNNEPLYDNEIGSFPSPNYTISSEKSEKMIWNYQPLKVGLNGKSVEDLKFQMGYNVLHHVDILVEPSFDGSVNLILNDGYNPPRLINSGFQVQDNYKAKIIQRYDSNNTNRYDLTNKINFNLQTSLYRNFNTLSKFIYEGTTDGGNLKVGNYVFYAVSCDKDGNESDIICESGVMSIFIGEDGNPFSVNGGVGNENSYKCIKLTVDNIDSAYSYIKLYYTRTTAQNNQLAETLAYKINKLYKIDKKEINNKTVYQCTIIISGNEVIENIDINDLNIQYFNPNTAKAQALTQNMLFLANTVQDNGENSEEYDNLRKLSVRIIPKAISNIKVDLDQSYKRGHEVNSNIPDTKNNYYFTKFIYDTTGYHNEEYYRFGIVYIRKDGSLTPVFNTLGYVDVDSIEEQIWTDQDWSNTYCIKGDYNNAGVVKINYNNEQKTIKDVIGIQFELPSDFANKTTNYKGYFFVRQKRIPIILCQGYATNVCEEAYVPSINYENNKNKRFHLFESFVQGNFKLINTSNEETYPLSTGNSKNSLLLNQNYNKRLFNLTTGSQKTYAFFDRYSAKNNVFGEFYAHLGGSWNNTNELNSGTRFEIYGGPDYDKYLTLYSNNANPDGTSNYKAKKYYSDFYYFVKVTLVSDPELLNNPTQTYNYNNKTWTRIQQYSTIPNYDQNDFEGWFLNDKSEDTSIQRLIYKDTKTDEYLLIWDSSWGFEEGDDQSINEENNSNFKYEDDKVFPIAKYVSRRYCSKFSKVTSTPWQEGYMECPVFIELEGNYYTYIAFGPGCAERKWGDLANKSLNWLVGQIGKTQSKESITSSNINSNDGIDLSVPTFNGKYQYTTDINLDEIKKLALEIEPLEQFAYAVYCPEFELNSPYYNNFFTGNSFKIKPITSEQYLTSDKTRLYKYNNIKLVDNQNLIESKAISVNENVSLVSLQHNSNNTKHYFNHGKNVYFSTKAGNASEVGFKFAGAEFLIITDSNNILLYDSPFNMVRGIYGPYVGIFSKSNIANKIINIYSSEIDQNTIVENRAQDSSQYYAISDRIDINTLNPEICYRGDCYIGYFTHRVNRNFQDPTAPYNDTIVDKVSFNNGFKDCFSVEYRTFDTTKEGAKHFNLGDINAIQLGSWVTFPVRSTMNISLRAIDRSYVDERLLCGNDRSFYPVHGIDASGSYKIPESDAFNVGFNKSGSERIYFNLNQIVYNKVYYKNRICYSNVLQSSALTNGNRIFLSEHYRDYTEQYGEIIKLIDISGNLLVVCEHGVMLVPVNERALVSEADGGPIVVNSTNVLPENPKIISDTYGSQWEESIISTPYGVYGVDASNKKIWWTDGNTLKTISDFKVQEFLNNYLQVSQVKDITKCNIKTHYIKYKNDVIFTLYDDNKSNYWNLCWNINEEAFKTFYSWLPYDSQNIGNNLVSIPLHILLDNEHKHYLEEGGSSTVGEVTRYDSDGIICSSKLEDRKFYLWKHGHSNIIPTKEKVFPTKFYDNQHPFEFEFIVKENPDVHKIFDNLQIISNKAAPESFHYEIVGECYDFGKLKKTAYIRQEAIKKLYNDSKIDNIKYDKCENENVKYDKSNYGRAIIFPLYYKRVSRPNLIYDEYKNMFAKDYNYDNLSGTEIIHYPKLNEYRLINHAKAVDVHDKGGLLRGNMQYKEDKWCVQINPINYVVGNESEITWKNNKPPILLSNIKLDEKYDGQKLYIPNDVNVYARWKISERKEVNVKDKFIKIKVRYTGNELAIISAIKTLYRISYA